MIISKVTVGSVVQSYDTEKKEFVEQNFIAGDEVSWENEVGDMVDQPNDAPYLPFDMKQPKENDSQYEIQKHLVLSTGHVTEDDMKKLADESKCPLSVYSYEYGANIHVGDEAEEKVQQAKNYGMSEAFQKLVQITIEQGCSYLKLDCDGQQYDHLEVYDW